MSALKELETHGYLVRTRLKDEAGRFGAIVYDIFEEPRTENPVVENPNQDSRKSEKSDSGNPDQLITNLSSNKSINDTKESNTYEKAYAELLDSVSDNDVRELYEEYIEMRKEIGSPLSKRGLKMLMERVDRLSNFDKETAMRLIETAVIKNWRSVYTPNGEEEPEHNKLTEEFRRNIFG